MSLVLQTGPKTLNLNIGFGLHYITKVFHYGLPINSIMYDVVKWPSLRSVNLKLQQYSFLH